MVLREGFWSRISFPVLILALIGVFSLYILSVGPMVYLFGTDSERILRILSWYPILDWAWENIPGTKLFLHYYFRLWGMQ